MSMLSATTHDNKPIYIAIKHIVSVEASNTYPQCPTRIICTSNVHAFVRESVDTILRSIPEDQT